MAQHSAAQHGVAVAQCILGHRDWCKTRIPVPIPVRQTRLLSNLFARADAAAAHDCLVQAAYCI